jgi:SAM-dependent methyltransferase
VAAKNKVNSEPEYTMGYGDEFRQLLERRSAETHAAHLLPHLKPGMRVLDFGCGPGTISLGLAKAIEPGELDGIDITESQIEMARAAAAAGGHENATFHVGDVTDMPFESDSFDVAHCHTLLSHVPDTQAVLTEVRRVLKPGGIISSRELITNSSFIGPSTGNLDDMWPMFSKGLLDNGGHPQMGIELKGAFSEAGFLDIQTSASFETFGSDVDVAFLYKYLVADVFPPARIAAVRVDGPASQKKFEKFRRSVDEWKDHPGAFAAFAWGEAIAQKPD